MALADVKYERCDRIDEWRGLFDHEMYGEYM
jgi:hypothetical protein